MEKWTLDNFPVKLEDLKPKAREKAVEIANQLMESGKYSEEEALQKATQQAQQWFYESEG